MTRLPLSLALLLGLSLACARATPAPVAAPQPAPASVNAAELVDHAGDSPQTAISVPVDAPDGGADFENHWIFDQYGRFRRQGSGTGSLDGRRYNVVKIELANGETKKVYFDITELWAKSLQQ